MRETKFRVFFYDGKDKSTGEYIDPELALSEDIIEISGYNLQATDECAIIEQFTGLYDKKGREIYEGDIVKYENDAPGLVVFNITSFGYWTIYRNHFCVLQHFSDVNRYEIIGNINENPELMNRKEDL